MEGSLHDRLRRKKQRLTTDILDQWPHRPTTCSRRDLIRSCALRRIRAGHPSQPRRNPESLKGVGGLQPERLGGIPLPLPVEERRPPITFAIFLQPNVQRRRIRETPSWTSNIRNKLTSNMWNSRKDR